MSGEIGRRRLGFTSLSEVMPEVDRLLLGHETVGNWTLGQICHHLSGAIIASIGETPFRLPWIVRKTVGPIFLRRILRSGQFPEGIKVPEKISPRPGLDARAEAEALRGAIQVFRAHPGPFAGHPLADKVDRQTWERFHAIHAAHHLGFAAPEADGHDGRA